jgi:putative aldouronate transport system permease protein
MTGTGNVIRVSPPKKGFIRKYIKPYWHIYVMLLPAVVVLGIFSYGPMPGILLAFKKYNARAGILGSAWVGLKNFNMLFTYSAFWNPLRNTVIISCGRLLLEFPAAVLMALMLNEIRSSKYRRTLQTVSTFPHFLSWIIVAGIIKNILRLDGMLNAVLVSTPFFNEPFGFLTTPGMFRALLYTTNIWKEVGWSSIIYLAAIAGIDEQLYEAAIIDGAGRFKQTLHITLPGIATTLAILFILNVGGFLNAGFDQIFNMRNQVVEPVGNILDTYVFDIMFREGTSRPDYGFATAVGLFKSVIGMALLFGADFFSRKVSGRGIYTSV